MSEYRISSADIAIRCDATIDDLIDVLEVKSRRYMPVVYALNKIDSISIEELDLLYRIPNACPISAEHGWNVDELLELMWEKLNLRRVYTKPKGKLPDYTQPVVLRSNASTVEDFVSGEKHSLRSRRLLFDRRGLQARNLEWLKLLRGVAVQFHSQVDRRAIQACGRLRLIRKASTAACRADARASR